MFAGGIVKKRKNSIVSIIIFNFMETKKNNLRIY